MASDENTAINQLIHLVAQRPAPGPDLFSTSAPAPGAFVPVPPAAHGTPHPAPLPPAPVVYHAAPHHAAPHHVAHPVPGLRAPYGMPAPLPRRRAPSATPAAIRQMADYADDAATEIDPHPEWAATDRVARVAFDPLDHRPTMPIAPRPAPVAHTPRPRPATVRAERAPSAGAFDERPTRRVAPGSGYPVASSGGYPIAPHAAYPVALDERAYYMGPTEDSLQTVRVRPLPLSALDEPDPPGLARELWVAVRRLWAPILGFSAVAIAAAVYLAASGTGDAPARGDDPGQVAAAAPVVMTPEPVAAAHAPAAPSQGVPADSPWQPTTPQPTIVPIDDTPTEDERDDAARAEALAQEIAMPADPAPARERARDSRRAKRAERRAERARRARAQRVARAERPRRADKAAKEPTAIAIAAARPMKIGGEKAAATGTGRLAVTSTPATLIYVDGRNTGLVTPRTLSLPAGNHKITLLSAKDRIARTMTVEIKAGATASLAKTFPKP